MTLTIDRISDPRLVLEIPVGGSLTVKCDVPDNTTIQVKVAKNVAANTGFFKSIYDFFFTNTVVREYSCIKINIGSFSWKSSAQDIKIIFEKAVGKNVDITCSGEVIFQQDVGEYSRVKTESGDIRGRNFAKNTALTSISGKITGNKSEGAVTSTSGNIVFDTLSNNAQAKTVSGDIKIRNLTGLSTAKTVSGDIKIVSKDPNTRTQTTYGKVKVKTVTRELSTSSTPSGVFSSSSPTSTLYNKHTKQYLESFDRSIPFSIQLEELKVDDAEIPREWKDPVTFSVCDHPLSVQGFIIDKSTVDNLLKNARDGRMVNPHTNSRQQEDLFTLADLQPNRAIKSAIEDFIEKKRRDRK